MNIPAPIMSSLKMAIYLGGVAFVGYLATPSVIEKLGLPTLIASLVAIVLKGLMTFLTEHKPQ